MQFFGKTNIDFLGKRKIFAVISAIVLVVSVTAAIILKPNVGIDFQGGTEIAVKFDEPVSTQELREIIDGAGFQGGEIKSFGAENQFLIRIKETGKEVRQIPVLLAEKYPGFTEAKNVLKSDTIGPKIGGEMYLNAVLAVVLAVVFILLYIAFRFEFTFGLGAVVALVHDVLITFGLIVIIDHTGLINLEFNQAILAALLTVVGYSINDTVIIFDRIRENTDRHKGMNFTKLANMSINETLSRTVNTTLTSTLVFITIILFGGPVLQGLAFTMFIGIITGTYSSVFIASSFMIWYREKVLKEDLTGTDKKKAIKPKTAKAIK